MGQEIFELLIRLEGRSGRPVYYYSLSELDGQGKLIQIFQLQYQLIFLRKIPQVFILFMFKVAIQEKQLFDPWNSVIEHVGYILLQFSAYHTLIEINILSLILVILSRRISFNSVIPKPFQELLSNLGCKLEVLETVACIVDSCMVIETNSAYIEPTEDDPAGAHDARIKTGHNGQVFGFRQVETSLVGEIPVHDPHFAVATRVEHPPLPLLYLLEHSVTARVENRPILSDQMTADRIAFLRCVLFLEGEQDLAGCLQTGIFVVHEYNYDNHALVLQMNIVKDLMGS